MGALENRPVTPTARLKDIATVRYDLPEWKFRVRAMSRPPALSAFFRHYLSIFAPTT